MGRISTKIFDSYKKNSFAYYFRRKRMNYIEKQYEKNCVRGDSEGLLTVLDLGGALAVLEIT